MTWHLFVAADDVAPVALAKKDYDGQKSPRGPARRGLPLDSIIGLGPGSKAPSAVRGNLHECEESDCQSARKGNVKVRRK